MFKITWKNIVFLCLIAIPNTLFTFGILYIINGIVAGKNPFYASYIGQLFFLIVVLSFGLNMFLQRKIIAFTFNAIYENELKIFTSLQQTTLRQLEAIGPERIYGIVEDVRLFAYLPSIMSGTISSLISLVICLIYYFILSFTAAMIVVSIISVMAIGYVIYNKRLFRRVQLLRKLNDLYFKVVDDTLKGFKELKLSTIKSTNLFEKFLRRNRKEVRDVEIGIVNRYLVLNLFSQYGLYLLLGIVLFVLPLLHLLNRESVISFVVILLFIIGPITNLIGMQNFYTRSYVANKRVNAFLEDLKDMPVEAERVPEEFYEEVEELRFEEITYQHQSDDFDSSFVMGPINLTIKKGETIFIIGGNGSGKSTFINCLTGLYRPSGGSIYLNGKKITNDGRYYKDKISAIFTDNHLFSRNYDNYSLKENKEYGRLLEIMKLDTVVLDDREESARRKFSKGQGKRMAMIFALLEDSPILVLDEWAADQDPYFRRYFYEKLLPQLKAQGKTIIAVTHDDAYFKYADRILKFDYGKIVRDLNGMPREGELLWEL
ncbi:putative ATP-binding cassette transporter/putative ATP-binding cassette transporter [Mucilaginibacter lappiensis]|uniref:Cyclic peptide transporter n=1 Tax=Mucilaginibacter lappiensis TaxID=354630 RepID=A0ABR6PS42_9SPHI|nr:cyclic peptide export ABC transporter [Mucilaginibacter lappiensis]MBB6112607.1 cyclic peptide transporter [Mucilaginibacter lappiensis]SIS05058.1 putative ATP-binding cassette transporter/putative ATP-binding cassette transporter [Mucilaginibacter lappiensis]